MNKNILNKFLWLSLFFLSTALYSPVKADVINQAKESYSFLVFIDPQGVITLLDPISGSVAELFYAQPGNTLWPSPSGKNLLVNNTWLTISQSVDGTFSVKSEDLPASVMELAYGNDAPSWSPDESMVSYKSSSGAVWIIDNSGNNQRILQALGTVSWSPSKDWLAFCGLDKQLWVGRSIETVRPVDENLLCGWQGFSMVSWSPTADLLAYTTGTTEDVSLAFQNYDHKTKIFDVNTDLASVLAEGEAGEWTKDGKLLLVNRVLSAGSGGISRDVYAINVPMRQSINIQSHIDKSPGKFTWFNTDNKYFYGSHQVSSDATSKTHMGGELMGVSQNGEMGLIYRDYQSIHCLNFGNNSERKLLDTYRDEVPAAIWPAIWADLSSDGRWASIFYIGIKDGEEIGGTYLYDCHGERPPLETNSQGSFSPDSRWWATVDLSGSTQIIELSTGQSVYKHQFEEHILTHAYWITSDKKVPGPEKQDTTFEGQIAYIGQDGNVYILRGDTGETIQVTRDATSVQRYLTPKISYSGEYLAFARAPVDVEHNSLNSLFFVYEINQQVIQPIAERVEYGFEWVAKENKISYIQDSNLYIHNMSDGNSTQVLETIRAFSWSPSAKKIIYTVKEDASANLDICAPPDIRIRDMESQNEVKITYGNTFSTWSADDKYVAIISACIEFGRVFPVDTNTGEEVPVKALEPDVSVPFVNINWAPAGHEFVAAQTSRYSGIDAVVFGKPGEIIRGQIPLLIDNNPAIWSPDNRYIAVNNYQDGFNLLDAGTMKNKLILAGPIYPLTWSPMGQQILLANKETEKPELMIYDIASSSVILRGIFVDKDFVYSDGMWAKLAEGEANTYTISGKVTKIGDNSSVAGVDIFLNGTVAATTNQNGEYRIDNVSGGTHLIRPKTDFLDFIPPFIAVNLTENRSDLNFVASEKTQDPVIYLEAIEVTQGLQNLRNTIPLIANKETVVRVYFTSTGTSPTKFEGRLIGRRNGEEISLQLPPITNSIDVYPGKNIDDIRDDFSTTLNFSLPTSWMRGDVEIEFISENFFVSLLPDGKSSVKVSFVDMPVFEIDVFRVVYRDKSGEGHLLDNFDIKDLIFATQNYLPISNISFRIREEHFQTEDTNLTDSERLEWVNNELWWKRVVDGCEWDINCKQHYVGVLDNGNSGLARQNTFISSGYWSWDDSMEKVGKSRSVFAHELAHTLGRLHTPTTMNLLSETCLKPEKNQDYPPYLGLSENTMGQDAAYGLAIKQGDERYVVIPPTYADLMSYCVHNWTSQWTYEKLFHEIRRRYGYSEHQATLVSESLPYFIVGGAVSDDMNVNISSIYSLNVNTLDNNSFSRSGEYILQSEDGQGNIIAKTHFSLENGIGSEYSHQSIFLAPLAFSPEAKSISVLYEGRVLDRIDSTENVPIINLISPNGGENWSGDKDIISWEASDSDGDELQYIVQLSYDGGQTWRTEAANLTETYLELPLESIPGTNQALVRILASDGFHTTQAVSSSTFTIAEHNPYVYITTPTDGHEYLQGQHILLYGDGYDVDDAQLSDSAFSWRSNKNGVLGQGKNLTIPAGELQSGEHLITLLVTDSGGLSAESSITIFVRNPDESLIEEPSQINPSQWWIYAGIATGIFTFLGLTIGAGIWLLKISQNGKKDAVEVTNISRGIRLTKEKKYQESFEILRQAVQENPNDAEAWLFLGIDLANLGDNTGAKRCFERAKRLGAHQANQALVWLEKRSSKNV